MAFSLKFLFTVTEKQCSIFRQLSFYVDYTAYASVADLGEGPGAPLFWAKKEEMTEGKRASRARKSRPPPPPPSTSGSATAHMAIVTSCWQIYLVN